MRSLRPHEAALPAPRSGACEYRKIYERAERHAREVKELYKREQQKQQQKSERRTLPDRDTIIAANPILDYCRARGWELRRNGKEWECLCPLHNEKTPSFKINPEKKIFHCFGCGAGGSVIDLHVALRGIMISEAMRELSGEQQQSLEEVAAYLYRDEDGYPLFEVVRFFPKDFKQFRVDENGERIWKGGMGDTRRVPYRLPQVLAADEVFIVEGEKDADVLVEQAERVATCNPGGAGKWRSEYAQYLKGKRVYIIPDQDEPGRKHGEQVARSVVGVATSVFWVDLPQGVKDIADFAALNGQAFVERLDALLKQARLFELLQTKAAPPVSDDTDPRDFSKADPTVEECGIPGEESRTRKSAQNEKSEKMEPLTFRSVSEILAMQFDDSDFILKNGYIAKGDPFAFCGAGGIGKSRLILQLLIAIIIGRDFLGWQTCGKATHWLLLQSENVCRRLKSDLWAMCSTLTAEEKQLVDECLLIHTLETGDDSFLHLNIPENQERIAKVIEQRQWTGVVFDVLRDYSVDDLSPDAGMQDTLAVISRLVRKNNPHCIIGIAHHARTGKAGAASATGLDRTSFGRNSKVLLGWVRAQINFAPYNSDDNEVLLVASAKCNNAPEFKPFAIRLDLKTMFSERDDSIGELDIAEWADGVAGTTRAKPKEKKTKDDLLALVPDPNDIEINALIVKASDNNIGEKKTRVFVDELVEEGILFIRHKKRSGKRDEIRISRYPEIPAPDAAQPAQE